MSANEIASKVQELRELRRMAEELGITGLILTPVGEVAYRADVGGGLIEDEVVQVFTAVAAQNLPMALNPEEVQAARWVRLPDLMTEIVAAPDQFTPWLRIYLTQHRTQIFGGGMPL